jgi:dethiobiotin synthetase
VIRPARLVVVAGTETGVGKTWVAARAAEVIKPAGLSVAVRKPVQSFDPSERGSTDAEVLATASGELPEIVCAPRRWYAVPFAPPMASDALGRPPFTIVDLVEEVAASWYGGTDLGLVELAGGPRSPIAHDGDGVALTAALAPDLVALVANAGLGTINAVRMSAELFAPLPIVVMLNRYDETDDLHRRNEAWLRERCDLDVVTDLTGLISRVAALRPRAG